MKYILSSLIIVCSSSLFAQTISTEAPSVSSCGTTVPKNAFQIETSLGIAIDGSFRQYSIPSSLFRLGLTNRIELRLSSGITLDRKYIYYYPGEMSVKTLSLNPIQVGAKFQFIKDPNKNTKIALISHVEIPEMDFPRLYANVNLAVSHQIKDKHTIGYNVGFSSLKEVTYSTHYLINQYINYSLIYSYSLNSKLTLFAEGYGNTGGSTKNPWDYTNYSFDFGVMYLLRNNIQIDYAFGRGISNTAGFHSIGFNILLYSKK